jgi:outer membrane protein OmpA-like peptidoglycan-associated protein/uncharacterized protein YegP (UPF0339 family)
MGTPDAAGFFTFESEGSHYFSFIENGRVVLCSEGYTTESGRDNGIASVQKNMALEERYSVVQIENGKWVMTLKAGNHKEIARSCEVASKEEAKSFLPSERTKAKLEQPITVLSDVSKKSDISTDDNYMICREYEEQFSEAKLADGIIKFQHESNNQFYFAWYNSDGSVKMRSEGYLTSSACDNGIEALKKNRNNKERYSNLEYKGAHFLILKAGNNKEIARSCPKKSADEAWALFSATAVASAIVPPSMLQDSKPAVEETVVVQNSNENTTVEPIGAAQAAPTKIAAMNTAEKKNETVEETGSSMGLSIWWILIPLLLLLFGYLLWQKGCFNIKQMETKNVSIQDSAMMERTHSIAVDTALDSSAMAAKAAWALSLGDMTEVILPDGTKIQVPTNGDEKKLIEFLNKGCQGNLKSTWFNMDRILFNTGLATLHNISHDQITNIATIMKAYPNAEFKIGGYTDNSGPVEVNKKLSADRAATAMNAIIGAGIFEKRLSSEGYGPLFPVCPENNTEECKAKNRRVALRIVKCN